MATWTFTQLGGDNKIIELNGYLAPFGRPRQKPILKETVRSRVQTTRYPGSKGPPIRAAFGTNWEDMELTGRWMTKSLPGGGNINDFADEWLAFVRDEQPVRVSWGWILSYTVFIEEIELGRESEHEIEWRMKLLVDQRDDFGSQRAQIARRPSSDTMNDLNAFVKSSKLQVPVEAAMSLDLLDQLDLLAGEINTFSASLNKLAGDVDNLERATFATIEDFRNGITGIKSALISFRNTVLNADIDTAVTVRRTESEVAWIKYQCDLDAQMAVILDLLGEMDLNAQLVQKQHLSRFVLAEDQDTWESLSTRATGGPDKAGAIRTANGIFFGMKPQPGVAYLVP